MILHYSTTLYYTNIRRKLNTNNNFFIKIGKKLFLFKCLF